MGDKMTRIIKYIFLGIIQGICEPLPISSSGHVFLFKNLFNTTIFDSLNFEIISNFGSFLAIFIIFWKDIKELVISFFEFIFNKETRKKNLVNFRYCIFIIISTIPVGITGILLKDKIGNLPMWGLGIAFLVTAISLFIVKDIKGNKEDRNLTIKEALIIGLGEAITIIPGISRSGTVLVACLLCKLKRETALKYTFMLYFPVSIATMILGVKDLIHTSNLSSLLIPYACGFIASGIVTYFTYKWLSNIVKKGELWKFSIYCFLLAIFIFIYFR